MKEPVVKFSTSACTRSYFYQGCDFTCVLMSSCVVLKSGQVVGREDIGPMAAFYFLVPGDNGFRIEDVCVKLVSQNETIYIVLDCWPEGSAVLETVVLPPYFGNNAPMQGEGGAVVWSLRRSQIQMIKRYVRLAPTELDVQMWRAVRLLYEQCVQVPAEFLRLPPGLGAKKTFGMQAGAEIPPGREFIKRTATGLGAGYLVNGNIFVNEDFSRVITLDGSFEGWCVMAFTRKVLQVLLENKEPYGLTSDEIYEQAKSLFVRERQSDKDGRQKGLEVPKSKSLGQFFRLTRDKKPVDHPIYLVIEQGPEKPPTYRLPCERVEAGDPRLSLFIS